MHELHQQAERRAEAALSTAGAAEAALQQDLGEVAPRPEAVPGPAGGADALDETALQAVTDLVAAHAAAAVDAHARLVALGPDVRRWDQHETELAAHRAVLADAESALLQVQGAVDALPARVAGLTVRLDGERTAAAGLAAAVHDVERCDHLVADAAQLAEQVALAVTAEAADIAARARARAEQQSYDRLRRARLAGMSVELARGLLPGEPCTVCGATEHPAPAGAEGEVVDADTEERARDLAARAAEVAARSGAALAQAAARRDASHARLLVQAAPEVEVPEVALLDAGSLEVVRAGLVERASRAGRQLAEARAAPSAPRRRRPSWTGPAPSRPRPASASAGRGRRWPAAGRRSRPPSPRPSACWSTCATPSGNVSGPSARPTCSAT
jgi:exonuclease SbcC